MKNRGYFLPASIVIAAILISGSVIFSAGRANSPDESSKKKDVSSAEAPAELISPVSDSDHIRGPKSAPMTIIEYTDFECPYCDDFHKTMKKLMNEYEGKLTWVERHFPMKQLHSKAPKEARAAECAAKLGGNSAFWDFSDKIFKITPSNNRLDLSKLPQIAEDIGLNRVKFEKCLESGATAGKVKEDLAEAEKLNQWSRQNTGRGIGTPYSVFITEDGKSRGIAGAFSYQKMKIFIDSVLKQN